MMQGEEEEESPVPVSSQLREQLENFLESSEEDEETIYFVETVEEEKDEAEETIVAAAATATTKSTLFNRPQHADLSSYDPFSPNRIQKPTVQSSLLDTEGDDDGDDEEDITGEDDIEKNRQQQQPHHRTTTTATRSHPLAFTIIDSEHTRSSSSSSGTLPRTTMATIPGAAGFLEMEEEPPRSPNIISSSPPSSSSSSSPLSSSYEPIQTSSGLLLTHRRTPMESKKSSQSQYSTSSSFSKHHDDEEDKNKKGYKNHHSSSSSSLFNPSTVFRSKLEVENPWSIPYSFPNNNSNNNWRHVLQRLHSYARMWILLSALVLLVGTTVVVQHMKHEVATGSTISKADTSTTTTHSVNQGNDINPGPIVLLPLPNAGGVVLPQNQHQQQQQPYYYYLTPQQQQQPQQLYPQVISYAMDPVQQQQQQQQQQHHHHRRLLVDYHYRLLRQEFEQWAWQHQKMYATPHEKEQRFLIWTDNYHKTAEKNARHGPCQLTNQVVFGSNHLQDLSPTEFQSQYLTGYTGPRTDQEVVRNNVGVLGPHVVVAATTRHPVVHRRIQEHWKYAAGANDNNSNNNNNNNNGNIETVSSNARNSGNSKGSGLFGCDWFDISCMLRYIFRTYLYGLGTTMEPKYDADSYPESVDWRDIGAVTEVHSQGNCGACWAITAVETVESAYFIATGQLYDLSETEVIVCAEECEMCAGGWPQDAFEYVMEHNGVPLRSDIDYDGNWLLQISNVLAGESDELDEDTVKAYMNQICPAGGGGGNSHSGSQDSGDNGGDGSSYNNFSRYGKIEGYGYATDKCTCYTDGSGCECDSQNESMAVRNVATYGPAVVCFDASSWQDYAGGIITSESGCSSHFMDVNHCAQVVGYAYVSDGDDEAGGGGSGSHSGSGDHGGSKDDRTSRSGYWIVRNQWSEYWGMNGYAYVAMGDNTCGLLNDMVIAYA